ncbi:hypothetical protein GGR31_000487 [Mesonia maritima]|uniref:Uncharacterized protein n=1 Tax=Mesonia maritima TaxID=1793873 RepID=A0ABU1K3I7_9FLAO|nr:hypothetical protein [Mesonia maritima]
MQDNYLFLIIIISILFYSYKFWIDNKAVIKNIKLGKLLYIIQLIPGIVIIYLILADKLEWIYILYLLPLILLSMWFRFQFYKLKNNTIKDYVYLFIFYLIIPILVLYYLFFKNQTL